MNDKLHIRTAQISDAEELLAIYKPYIENTAITFEYDVPSIEEFAKTLPGGGADQVYECAGNRITTLQTCRLIKRAGSRKTGAYTVTDMAACDTTCATCSIALQCKDYKPV